MIYNFKKLSQRYGKAIQMVVYLMILFGTSSFSCSTFEAFRVQNNSNILLESYCIPDTVSEDNFMNRPYEGFTCQPHSRDIVSFDIPIFTESTSGIITVLLIDSKKAHDPKINPFAQNYFSHLSQFSKYICIVYEVDIYWMEEHDWIITYPYPMDPNVKYVRSVNGILTTSVDDFGPHFPPIIENSL